MSASAVAWAGAAAFLVCLLVRKVAPYPRWDLLACLAVSGGAVAMWWWRARKPTGSTGPRGARSRGRAGRARWWPARRSGLVGLALWALFLPLAMLAFSAVDTTPRLAEITHSGPVLSRLTIKAVHSTSRSQENHGGVHYNSSVSVAVPGTHGTRLTTEEVTTSKPLRKGDGVWALHSSRNAAAGALLSPSQDELRALLDGTASGHEMLLLALSGCACAGYAALALREGTSPRRFNADLIANRSRMLRVRITGAGAGLHFPRPARTDGAKRHCRLHPALRLTASSGDRALYLDRCLDPVPLAKVLASRSGWLYWRPGPDGQPGWSEPALLVLDDGRFVMGATPDGPIPDRHAGAPAGEPVTQPLPSPEPTRAVGPYVLWQPQVHKPGLIAFGVGFLSVCLIAAGIGYGNGTALAICLATTVLGPTAGLLLIARRRSAYLRGLRGT
ncbi:hypothetical protein [Streptomyces sp. NPDC048637]|uniref:hypothetical protein n=1 Tax=Streptomyces sp. NPDC048637 TaxID=3155636 RepID=UPI00344AB9D1